MKIRKLAVLVVVLALTAATFTLTYVNWYEEYEYFFALGLDVTPDSYSAGFLEGGNGTLVGEKFMDPCSKAVYRLMLRSFEHIYVKVYRIRDGELEDIKTPLRSVPWFKYNLKAESIEAVMYYLKSLEEYLQTFKNDEFIVEVYLRCLNESKASEVVQKGREYFANYFYKKVVEVLYIGKGGKMIAFTAEPYYTVLLKFKARILPSSWLLYRLCLATFLSPIILVLTLLAVGGYKQSSEKNLFFKINLALILVLSIAHVLLVASLAKEQYNSLREVSVFSIYETLAPLGFTKTLELTLSKGNISICLKDVVSEYELQALKRVCSYFKETNALIVVEPPLDEFVKVHYLNASITKTENGVLVPLEEIDKLVIVLSVEKLKNYKTCMYITIGVPVKAYRVHMYPKIIVGGS